MKSKVMTALVAVGMMVSIVEAEYHSYDDHRFDETIIKQCNEGNSTLCIDLGLDHMIYGKDYEKAIQYYQKACELGDSSGYVSLGSLYEEKKKDIQKAISSYQKACEVGNPVGCYFLGNIYISSDVQGDFNKAVNLFQKACEEKEDRACFELGKLYYEGQYLKKDLPKAINFLEKSCYGWRSPNICGQIGSVYLNGDMGIPKNQNKAKQLFEKGCDRGDSKVCLKLSSMYYLGQGVMKDKNRAIQLIKNACELEDNEGCKLEAEIYLSNKNMKDKINENAIFIIMSDCNDKKNQDACYTAAKMHEKGVGIFQSTRNAIMYYKKACDLGNKESCKKIKVLETK